MTQNYPLMHNNITKNDINQVISFLKKNPVLTQSKKVEKFEKSWSKWLGVKYSVFVNSGHRKFSNNCIIERNIKKRKK